YHVSRSKKTRGEGAGPSTRNNTRSGPTPSPRAARPPLPQSSVAVDGGEDEERQDERLVLRAVVAQDRVEAQQIHREAGERRGERARRQKGQEPQRRQHRREVRELGQRQHDRRPPPRPRHQRHEDLREGRAEITVAAEVWIRAAAEVWHDPREIDEENEEARGEYRDAEGPAPASQREPETEADDGDRGVLPAPEREQERERAPSLGPGG